MTLTPPKVAKQLGVSPDKVIAWIRAGELVALNLATRPNGRPRYAIEPSALEVFKRRRSSQAQVPMVRSRRSNNDDVIQFFK